MGIIKSPVKNRQSTGWYGRISKLGGMAERTKATVLKTVVGQPTGGSNPSPSAELVLQISLPEKSEWAVMTENKDGKIPILVIIIWYHRLQKTNF